MEKNIENFKNDILFKKINIRVYSSGFILNEGSGLETSLLSVLNTPSEPDFDSENYNCDTYNEQGVLNKTPIADLFRNEIYLQFEFGKDIKLFDFITPNLFYSNSDIGNSFIDVLKKTEMIFIVYERIWVDQNTLEFELLMGETCNKRKMRERFLGTYKFD